MTIQKRVSKSIFWLCLGGMVFPISAVGQEYSPGIKLNGLTISPYVNVEVAYDSNIIFDGERKLRDFFYRINPGLDLTYQGNEWGMIGSLWYAHSWYQDYTLKNYDRWGERLSIYRESAKGWKIVVSESYVESDQNETWYYTNGGDGVWRNRHQLDINAALSYAFNERLSAGLNVMFSEMWYDNKTDKVGGLFGWQQWTVGGEVSHRLTERTRALVTAAYHEYYTKAKDATFSRTSRNYSFMGGLMSELTERIKYRAVAGVSLYEYGEETSAAPSYTLDASWLISKKLAATVAGAGYFQPNERTGNQRKTVYTLSGGLTYRPINRLTLTLDGIYRGEDNQTVGNNAVKWNDYSRNQYTIRAKANYRLQKYVSVYGAAEYTTQESNRSVKDDWERYLITVGLSLRY